MAVTVANFQLPFPGKTQILASGQVIYYSALFQNTGTPVTFNAFTGSGTATVTIPSLAAGTVVKVHSYEITTPNPYADLGNGNYPQTVTVGSGGTISFTSPFVQNPSGTCPSTNCGFGNGYFTNDYALIQISNQ